MIWILEIFNLVMEAGWDAQAFATGDSNHIYKILYLASFIHMLYIMYRNPKSVRLFVFVLAGYLCLRIALFDTILNIFRGLDYDYVGATEVIKRHLGKWMNVIRWLCGIIWVITVLIYYKELEYLSVTKGRK